jgi:hydroxymethylbilane synthase
MKKQFHIVCRGSWLSLAQAELFTAKVKAVFPEVELHTIIRETAGDKNQSTPLHLVEGKDFFTKDIQDFLKTGGADFAVHSMKDVSSEEFFANHEYALFDRDDLRDVAIFNEDVIERLQQGQLIRIGTSSPRRSTMALDFLQQGLPWLGTQPRLQALPVRGNVDRRLQQLQEGKFDALILAAAGLNRLLRYEPAEATIRQLLQGRKMMLLPLFECAPAAGQGAIVAETSGDNHDAIKILQAINDPELKNAISSERRFADKYGYGCSREFGVFHLQTNNTRFTYAAGRDEVYRSFEEWSFDMDGLDASEAMFSTAEHMKDFFGYQLLAHTVIDPKASALFIASHKAVHNDALVWHCKQRRVWAAGVKTWLQLSQKGIWVQGCADGLGMELLQSVWEAPLFNLPVSQLQVITNRNSAEEWCKGGWLAAASYQLLPALSETVRQQIAQARYIFWTSFQQYELCCKLLRPDVTHVCPAGKTAQLFQQAGISPVIFPTIKAFRQWKQSAIRSHNVA